MNYAAAAAGEPSDCAKAPIDFDQLFRSVWGAPAPEPKTPEERLERARAHVQAAAGLAGVVIKELQADLRAEGLSEAVCGRVLSIGAAYGVPSRPADSWRDYLERLGWVLSFIAEPEAGTAGSC